MSATFDIQGPLPTGVTVLEASAGTGKTFAITALVTRYIVEAGHNVEDVLMVTFAKGAAAEMRERLRARLRDAVRALESANAPDEEWLTPIYSDDAATRAERLARAKDAVANLDRATVTTIHGFCHQALRRLGTRAGDSALAAEVNAGSPLLVSQLLRDEMISLLALDIKHLGEVELDKIEADAAKVLSNMFANHSVKAAPIDDSVKPDKARKWSEMVERLKEQITVARRESGSLSFDDMVETLKELLEHKDTKAAVRDQLRAQYKLVLIDEFQDTDMSQWQIFSEVFTPDAKDDSRVLVMVGDPKQAIYRFRGADVSAYIGAVNQPHITRHDMTVNWRSDADLITALNHLFDGYDFGQQKIPYVQVTPRTNAPTRSLLVGGESPKPFDIRWVSREDNAGFKAPTARSAISIDMANYIHELLANGRILLTDGGTRPVVARDIAILMRGNEDSKIVRDDLRALNIPVVEARVGGVNESDAFKQVEVLLNVLINVSDARRVRSLVFTWFTDLLLLDLDEGKNVEALQLKCAKWADDMAREGVSYMYEQLRAESDVMRQIARTETPARHLTDLEHVFELLSTATEDRAVAPSVALRHLDAIKNADNASETLLRRTETDADAVQITSMHSSKGLEYPIVLLPLAKAITTKSPHVYTINGKRFVDAAPKIEWTDKHHLDQNNRKSLAAAEEREDEARLIYVALTRAKHQLTIWWASTQGADKGSLGSLLFRDVLRPDKGEIPDVAVKAALKNLVDESGDTISFSEIPFKGKLVTSTLVQAAGSHKPVIANAGGVALRDYTWARWSYSSLTKDQHATREEKPRGGADETHENETLVPRSAGTGFAALKGGADFGTYLHKVMEFVDFTAADLDSEVRSVVESMAVPHFIAANKDVFIAGIVDAIRTPMAGLGSGAELSGFSKADRLAELRFDMSLGADAHTQLAKIASLAARETGSPFSDFFSNLATHWRDRYAAGFLTGSIDALFRVREGESERFLIVDYKSNMLARPGVNDPYGYESMRAEMEAAGYPLQALLYCVATHRFLKSRLTGYNPEVHLGTCGYLFMRGMVGADTQVRNGVTDGVFTWRPSTELVLAVDELLGGSNG